MKFLPSLALATLQSEWSHNSVITDTGKPFRVVTARSPKAFYGPIVRMFATLAEALAQLDMVNSNKYTPYAYVQVLPKGSSQWITVAKMHKGQKAPVILMTIEG